MQIKSKTLEQLINEANTWTHTSPTPTEISTLDRFGLITRLYQILKGGDTMPEPQQSQFREVYWEIYDRFLEEAE